MTNYMKHFPFFFILLFFISCKKETLDSHKDSNEFQLLKNKGYDFFISGNYDSSYVYFNKAYLISDSQEIEEQIYVSLFLADIHNIISDFNSVEEIATNALKISSKSIYNSHLYNLLGIAYEEKKDYSSAIENYNLAKKHTSSLLNQIIIENNIAVVLIEQGKYNESIKTLIPLLETDTLRTARKEYAKIIDNLGFAYFKNKDLEKGKYFLYESTRIRDSINNDYEKISSYIHLSKFHAEEEPQLAKEFAQNAYQFATNVNSPDDRLEALDLLIKNPTNKSAISDYERYHSLNDSAITFRQTAKNEFSKIKYDSKIAIERSEKLKIEKDLITYLFLGFGIITILVYFLIRSKNKRKLQKSAYETETRISKQLHDELANDVFNVMTQMQTDDFSNTSHKEKIVNQLETIYKRTRNISLENSEIDTGENFNEHLKSLISSFNSESVNVIIKNADAIDWKKTKELTKIAIYRVIQELLVNMKKHSQCNLAVISFENKDNQYQIIYSDNGVFGQKTLKLKNGLTNMVNRIKNIKGTIIFEAETQKGFKVKINFPK